MGEAFATTTMEVTHCGIHGFGETCGIDVVEIRVFWKLQSESEHTRQEAYRLVVSSDRSFDLQQLCFDSGRQESREQRNILCKPSDGFKSTTLYYWTVQIWDQDGHTATSALNEFYTSYPRCSRLLPPYSMNQTYVRMTLIGEAIITNTLIDAAF